MPAGAGEWPLERRDQSVALLIYHKWALAKRSDAACDENCLSPGALDMLDVIMLAIGLGFFALSVGYTIACDRL